MRAISYEQAYSDWEYLFHSIGCACDMTGGYVDQEDLEKLLRSPNKKTARDCLVSQIRYWFQAGLEDAINDGYEFYHLVVNNSCSSVRPLLEVDRRVKEIVERYNIDYIR